LVADDLLADELLGHGGGGEWAVAGLTGRRWRRFTGCIDWRDDFKGALRIVVFATGTTLGRLFSMHCVVCVD
jgi:hypothetical protein